MEEGKGRMIWESGSDFFLCKIIIFKFLCVHLFICLNDLMVTDFLGDVQSYEIFC